MIGSSTIPPRICYNYVDVVPDATNSTLAIVFFAIVYTLIFLIGIVGNVSIIYATIRHRLLQTVPNIFQLNIATANVFVCLFSLPTISITTIIKVWPFGKLMCHMLPLSQGVGVFVSTFSLTAIAIDRYISVLRPHANQMNCLCACIVSTAIWTMSTIVTLPDAVYVDVQPFAYFCGVFCFEDWPNLFVRSVYAHVMLVIQFLVPFAITIVCYSKIFM